MIVPIPHSRPDLKARPDFHAAPAGSDTPTMDERRIAQDREALDLDILTLFSGAHGCEGPLADPLDWLARRNPAALDDHGAVPSAGVVARVLGALTRCLSFRHDAGTNSARSAHASANGQGQTVRALYP